MGASLQVQRAASLVVVCSARAYCSVWASLVVALRLGCISVYGILVPKPGIEPESPALEGGFLTTGPLGRSPKNMFISLFISCFFALWKDYNKDRDMQILL